MMSVPPLFAEVAAAPQATNWLGFLGHFHPLLLHLPIGLVGGVLFLEVAALWRARQHGRHVGQVVWFEESRPYVGVATWLLAVSGVAAAFAGYFWRLNDFEPPKPDLHDHQVLGFWVAGGCVLVALLHMVAVRFKHRGLLWMFRVVLLATAVMLAPLGHLGGQLVHGKGFLSENAPVWLPQGVKDLLGKPEAKHPGAVKEAPQQADTVFAQAVRPILEARCAACHGDEKRKGQLRLNTMAGLLKGGADGPVLVAGKPEESALLTAVHAPLEDPEHMPPKDKPQPSADEVAVLAWWIRSGASFDTPFDAKAAPVEVAKALAALKPTAASPDAKEVAGPMAPVPSAAAISALRARQVVVQPLVEGSNLLWIDFAGPAAGITDKDLILLEPLAANVAQLGLARTQVTDAGLASIAELTRLQTLDLRVTRVTDAGLSQLSGLKRLKELNLVHTAVTDAGLARLSGQTGLVKLYLWGTKTTPAGVAKLRAALPRIEIDDGATPLAARLPDRVPPINQVCPVSGKPVDPAFISMVDGQAVGFCCADCKAKFDAALAGKFDNLEPVDVKPGKVKPGKTKPAASATVADKPVNSVCPVTGEPVDPAHTVEFEGKTIGFCCGKCPKTFSANPEKYKANLK